jgi:hypothetical protein
MGQKQSSVGPITAGQQESFSQLSAIRVVDDNFDKTVEETSPVVVTSFPAPTDAIESKSKHMDAVPSSLATTKIQTYAGASGAGASAFQMRDFWDHGSQVVRQQLGTIQTVLDRMKQLPGVCFTMSDLATLCADSSIPILPGEILYVESVCRGFAKSYDLWRRYCWSLGNVYVVCYTGPDGQDVLKRFLGVIQHV